MKPTAFITKFVALSIVLTLVAISAQAVQQGSARVIKLKGAARYSTGNNVWLPVSEGIVLKPGSVVQTASESWVDILLSGEGTAGVTPVVQSYTYKPGAGGGSAEALQNVVRLRENTLLGIDRLAWEQTGSDTVSDTQLDLRSGRIFGSVKKSSAASRYEIKLPNGVAGIRGTIYELSANGVLTVYVGSVVVTYLNPSNPSETITKVVNAGQEYDLNTDTYKQVPQNVLDAAIKTAAEAGTMETPQPTIWVKDPTVYHISPVIQ